MSRNKRKQSDTNIYHIMSRALNRELLFEEDTDYLTYLSLINKAKKEFNFKIYAYCLMTNHIHLLLHSDLENISKVMQWINSNYAMYFNAKYGRIGYVFANRFRSECIEDLNYFKNCIRYIHQNPVKALVCSKIDYYKFSSIHAYKNSASNYLKLVDTSPVLKTIDKSSFLEWNRMDNHDMCMDYFCNHYTDEELKKIVFDIFNIKNLTEYDKLDEAQKAVGALKLIDMYVPLRQVSRVTGLYYKKVQRLRLGVEGKVANLTYENNKK